MVLDDGETYSALSGCRIVTVHDVALLDDGCSIVELLESGSAQVVAEFTAAR